MDLRILAPEELTDPDGLTTPAYLAVVDALAMLGVAVVDVRRLQPTGA